MPEATPQARLAAALRPAADNADRLARQLEKLGNEISEALGPDVMAQIADCAEQPEGVGSHEVERLANITYRQLDSWTRAGYLCPFATGTGSGQRRYYPPGEVSKARTMGTLTRLFGMTPGMASRYADQLEQQGNVEVGGFRLTRQGLRS